LVVFLVRVDVVRIMRLFPPPTLPNWMGPEIAIFLTKVAGWIRGSFGIN